MTGVAAHPLLSEAAKTCLIYNLWTHTDFVDDNGGETARCRCIPAPQLLETSLSLGRGGCFSGSAGFEQTLGVSVRHASVPSVSCEVIKSWFLKFLLSSR